MKRLIRRADIELTPEEEELLRLWFGAGGKDWERGEQDIKFIKILEKFPNFVGGPVYRGIFASIKPWKPGTYKAMYEKASWTLNKQTALSFSDAAEDPDEDAVPILLEADNVSKYFKDLTERFPSEEEVISWEGANFEVLSVQLDESINTYVVKLKER